MNESNPGHANLKLSFLDSLRRFCLLLDWATTTCRLLVIIVITFYSPSCLGQGTAKESFGIRVQQPPAQLSTTHCEGFILSL